MTFAFIFGFLAGLWLWAGGIALLAAAENRLCAKPWRRYLFGSLVSFWVAVLYILKAAMEMSK
jgi:hypothetical protein